MLIEALVPIRVKLPSGGRVDLRPGIPIELPYPYGQKLLTKAPGKVVAFKPDWLGAWRQLSELTYGITKEDSRFKSVLVGLDRCDEAFRQDDWLRFTRVAEEVRQVVQGEHHGQ